MNKIKTSSDKQKLREFIAKDLHCKGCLRKLSSLKEYDTRWKRGSTQRSKDI